MNDDKFTRLVAEIESIENNMGIYPAAVKGFNDERDYEQRDGYKNGWNACAMMYGQKICEAVERSKEGINDDLQLLVAADVGNLMPDGSYVLNMSDTWAWACADCEVVPPDKVKEVAELFRSWGYAGLLYWVWLQHPGLKSEFVDINRFIAYVRGEEEYRKANPSSSKRAYDKDFANPYLVKDDNSK